MTDREQTGRDAVRWHDFSIPYHEPGLPECPGCIIVELLTELEQADRLVDACRRLIVAYDFEEDEHGFPFNFELRDAHREIIACLRAIDREDNHVPDGSSH